ncbi:MAG: NADH:ubiquinone reductase (Na(+)-transporting) subunit F, partial [Endozoicomonas sp.]
MDSNIIYGVAMFTIIVLALVLVILAARSKLVSTGDVTIEVNDDPEHTLTTEAGGK